jgi:hypothetical protein
MVYGLLYLITNLSAADIKKNSKELSQTNAENKISILMIGIQNKQLQLQ